MAGSSSTLDGPSFSGSYNNKMERSSSFREASETNNRASRSVQSSSSTEMPALSQYLSLEPVSLLGEQHKYSRSGELRRVLGVSLEDHSFAQSKQPIPDELKRFKASLADSSSKARERMKLFQEAITSVDKYKSVVSKRRQRNNEMSSEKPAFSKLNGAHQGPSEITGQRPNEDRPKSLVPNKRARSSLAESRSEGRGGSAMRQASVNNNTEKQRNSSSFEKDKNAPGGASEEKPRGLAPGGEGWEKKLKRKRSVGSMVNRATDNVDPPKQRPSNSSNSNAETRAARFNDNSGLPFRSGLGSTGMNKTEQSKVKAESDNHPSERRDKDRSLTKSNKLGSKDEPQSSSGGNNNTNSKAKASRGPRSNSFVTLNSSPSFSRFPNNPSDAWDPPSKSQPPSPSPAATSASNRKRAAANPPSPPVATWVGQRPHKIQRTRRAHVVSPVSNFEEGLTNEASPAGSQQMAESEESKGKGAENGDLGENNNNNNNSNNNSKMMSLSSKKNSRVMLKEELGLGDGGVRRQGRTGRSGTSHARSASLLSVPKDNNNKVDGTETVPKPPKSGRPASSDNKNDSRIGRPPLKKAVDRKSHGRLAQSFQTGGLDMTGEQEDDKEELMAAINAARTACYDASTGTFWKKMEPVFSLPSSDDFSFLKNQIAFAQELDKTACDILAPSYTEDKSGIDQSNKSDVATDDWFEQAIPLSQRLLSAFISSDDLLITENGNNDHHYPSSFDNKGLGFCNGFGVEGFLDGNNNNNNNGVNLQNGSMSHQTGLYEGLGFEEMSFDDRILVELHSIGIYPDSAPELDEGDGEIDKTIFDLQNQLTDQVKEKKSHLQKLEKVIQDVNVTDERHLEQTAMNKLVERACKKLSKQGGRGGSNHKNSNNKMTKQLTQAFAKRTLARCHKYEKTGHSCFADPAFKDLLFAPLPSKPTDGGGEKGRKIERGPSDLYVKPEIQKERTKKRELLLDEVSRGGAATSSFGGPKWKKSDQNKDNKNSNAKGGVRGERKNKAKPKQQKMAHLSAAAAPAQQNNSELGIGSGSKRGQQEGLTGLTGQNKESNEGLFTELPLSLDDLDVAGDGQDLGSWLNVDDEALQDNDLVGLQIPMDDLADLTFN
ncbi:hypothetical protein LUZ60_007416 [Juncus effusus]|nr:hypothetical protein LUZ60_007416 [Juncus effusus]